MGDVNTSQPVTDPAPMAAAKQAPSAAADNTTAATVPAPAPATATAPASVPTTTATAAATATAGAGSSAPTGPIDDSKPEDFEGELATNDELPSAELIKKIENYIVLDKDGRSCTFKSLYSGPNVPRRVLVIFVRHFFCGNCQDYLRSLCESISPDDLLQLPVSTFITVVGCGDPGLINMYTEATGCTFPIYTDPTRSLFQALDMVKTWTPGDKPAYSKRGLARGALDSIGLALRKAGGLMLKSGNFAQVGGEFLFEPLQLQTPISTPQEERKRPLVALPEGTTTTPVAKASMEEEDDGTGRKVEEKRVSWCHRMRTTRDHAEIPELREVLGLDGHGRPSMDRERWARAVGTRKGTGLSLASQMSQMSEHQATEAASAAEQQKTAA